jgi:hypothetical protein
LDLVGRVEVCRTLILGLYLKENCGPEEGKNEIKVGMQDNFTRIVFLCFPLTYLFCIPFSSSMPISCGTYMLVLHRCQSKNLLSMVHLLSCLTDGIGAYGFILNHHLILLHD